jgi:eukaryotic-like serine/threonine-protein kinase
MRTVGRSHALERPPLSVPLEGGPAIRLRCGHHPGARSYGTVFLAEQRPSYRLVALKVLNHSSHASETIERLQALRLSLHALGEHAARVYDVGVLAQGRPYVVTEWVRGTTITTFCQQSGCDRPTRQRLLDTVSDLISRSHSCGITHGGIKASNVFVAGDGPVVKVLDFGVCAAEATDDVVALQRLRAVLL